MEKGGQFFLVAALITAGILFGLTSIVNYAQGSDEDGAFYRLSDEISFETKRVLDYGTYYTHDTNALVSSFLAKYADYIAQDKVLFLFGNEENLSALFFTNKAVGSAGVNTGTGAQTFVIQEMTRAIADVTREGKVVTVRIDGISYEFSLLEGQNFFFVIIKGGDGEAFVAAR